MHDNHISSLHFTSLDFDQIGIIEWNLHQRFREWRSQSHLHCSCILLQRQTVKLTNVMKRKTKLIFFIGLKVAIMLEELADLRSHKGGFEYEPHTVDIRHGENRSLSFTHYCPPGKIPVIVDPATDGQPEATVWESGSILLYLSEKYHELLPLSGDDPKLRQETINWLFWASASFSPKVKTLGFYYKYCPHKLPYCISRYVKECNRLLHILEKQFAHNKQYIVGGNNDFHLILHLQ